MHQRKVAANSQENVNEERATLKKLTPLTVPTAIFMEGLHHYGLLSRLPQWRYIPDTLLSVFIILD